MDENRFYEIIGRLYSELLNNSVVVQNLNAVVKELQDQNNELRLSQQEMQEGTKPAPEPPPGFSPVPKQITNVSD